MSWGDFAARWWRYYLGLAVGFGLGWVWSRMTPAGVVITLAILAATFAGWLLGGVVADWRDRRRDERRFLAMTAAMRRMSTPPARRSSTVRAADAVVRKAK